MKLLNIIFIFLIGLFFMDCNRKESSNQPEIEVRSVTFIHERAEVESPPDDVHSNFKSVQEWLFNLCDTEKPPKPITAYDFGLSESGGNYTLYLVGLNDYNINEYHSATRIEFEPSDMYFPLPKHEYQNLDREQVLEKIKAQLKDFTNTEKFKTSFFSQAKSIKMDTNGEIWSK